MTLTTGQILQNRYRIVSLLGQGGMGAVYKAWDTRLNVHLAIKEMIPQPGLDEQTLEELQNQFRQEAQILARLSHSYLVRVTDFFEENDNSYLVMDFVEGESLSERITREGAMPEAQVLAWSYQLLDALDYCHAQGILHRDIKPQNVIIRSDGRAVLVDFGLVKLWDPNDPHTKTAMRGMGTPEYAPPEQYDAQSGHTDPRSDIYGLGATVYHALTGQAPPTATMRIASPRLFQPPSTLNPNLSLVVEAAVLRATELIVDNRFTNADEMVAGLKGQMPVSAHAATSRIQPMAGTKVMPGARVATGVQPAPATERRRVPVWVWALGGITILALIVVFAMSQIDPSSTSQADETITAAALTALDATDTPSPTPLPSSTPTEPPTPTSAPTDTPSPTDTPQPTSTSVSEPTASPTPTPEPPTPTSSPSPPPTSLPASDPTSTPVPSESTAVPAPPTSEPPPEGQGGRIFYTITAGSGSYLATTDPSWSQGQMIGEIDPVNSTCAGSTATTLMGQTANISYGYRCGLARVTECVAPNGVYKVALWETDGNYSMGVHRVDDNVMVHAIYNGRLNASVPILWSPDSSRFYFAIGDTLHSASPGSEGYQPVIPFAREPYLSPDGSMILYLQPVGTVGAYDVMVANADGSNQHNVTNVPGTYKECARWGNF
ncbi:MAG: serine/threonine protein kinase [Chloroflexi bacterium]|nr:serine/threonine protein kinase [Chloroflexota bacterium]